MKPGVQKRFAFIGKSMLWSLLLYVVMMLAFNWDEVSNTLKGSNEITIVNTTAPGNTNVSARATVTKSIIVILKTITGITTRSASY